MLAAAVIAVMLASLIPLAGINLGWFGWKLRWSDDYTDTGWGKGVFAYSSQWGSRALAISYGPGQGIGNVQWLPPEGPYLLERTEAGWRISGTVLFEISDWGGGAPRNSTAKLVVYGEPMLPMGRYEIAVRYRVGSLTITEEGFINGTVDL